LGPAVTKKRFCAEQYRLDQATRISSADAHSAPI
jgi:hypothetical protein